MKLDYKEIGRRIAHRRKQLGLKQATVEEMADIGEKYLSCIERATSTPSTEVLMRLAIALDTTPDDFWWARSASRMRPGGMVRNFCVPSPRTSCPWPRAS